MKHIFFLLIICSLSSCAELFQISSQIASNANSSITTINNSENIAGLKSALNVGIEKSVAELQIVDGFYKSQRFKIPFPEDAKPIIDNIRLIPGGKNLVDNAILSMNRSAEDAVNEALPIFKNAILNMSIVDAKSILFGGNTSATEYLKKSSYSKLKSDFSAKIDNSLNKPLVANVSTLTTWNTLSNNYNKVANSTVGSISGLKTVNTNLTDYITEKAIDALFVRVAEEEIKIRKDPAARVNSLLKKVFGQLDYK